MREHFGESDKPEGVAAYSPAEDVLSRNGCELLNGWFYGTAYVALAEEDVDHQRPEEVSELLLTFLGARFA